MGFPSCVCVYRAWHGLAFFILLVSFSLLVSHHSNRWMVVSRRSLACIWLRGGLQREVGR